MAFRYRTRAVCAAATTAIRPRDLGDSPIQAVLGLLFDLVGEHPEYKERYPLRFAERGAQLHMDHAIEQVRQAAVGHSPSSASKHMCRGLVPEACRRSAAPSLLL